MSCHQASYHQQFGKPSGEHCGGWGQRGVGEKTSETPQDRIIAISFANKQLNTFKFRSKWGEANFCIDFWLNSSFLVQIYDRGFVVSDGWQTPWCKHYNLKQAQAMVPNKKSLSGNSDCLGDLRSGWWQLKSFLFSPRKLGKMNPFWRTFFKWVGSTTN